MGPTSFTWFFSTQIYFWDLSQKSGILTSFTWFFLHTYIFGYYIFSTQIYLWDLWQISGMLTSFTWFFSTQIYSWELWQIYLWDLWQIYLRDLWQISGILTSFTASPLCTLNAWHRKTDKTPNAKKSDESKLLKKWKPESWRWIWNVPITWILPKTLGNF